MTTDRFDEASLREVENLQNQLEIAYVTVSETPGHFLARPFIDSHIRNTLKQLKHAYIRHHQILDDFPERDYFKTLSDSLDDFSNTFETKSYHRPFGTAATSFKSLVGVPGLATVLLISGAGSTLSEVFWDCYCHVMKWAALIIALYIVGYYVGGFLEKRELFLKANIYQLEDSLLRLMNRRRRPEVQLDAVGWLLAAITIFIAALALRNHLEDLGLYLFLILASTCLIVAIVSFIGSFRRPWAWSSRPNPTTIAD
jgi:hypothetical protein